MKTVAVLLSGKPKLRKVLRWLLGGLALVFGLATLLEGGRVIFGDPAARAAAGNVVQFVLVFNFGAGFVYLAAGAAILAHEARALWLARALAGATALVFLAFAVFVIQGGAFEIRTAFAMGARTLFWAAQASALAALSRQGDAKRTECNT